MGIFAFFERFILDLKMEIKIKKDLRDENEKTKFQKEDSD